jgi:hypothetical protein
MIPSLIHKGANAGTSADQAAGILGQSPCVKVATILDDEGRGFGLEYDDTRGRKNQMRLEALSYQGAVREARSFLGIQQDDHDRDGRLWIVE